MAKLEFLMVRMTKNQKERIRNYAESKGYKTVSSFIRNILLEKDLAFERKFNEMYEMLKGKG